MIKAANEKITQKVIQILLPVTDQAGLELVDVEFVKEGGRWYLRIFIDKPEGVNHEDCRFVSESIDALLDDIVPLTYKYYLEVSSPGIDRPLKSIADFERFTGKNIVVSTYTPIDGKKKFDGLLRGVRDRKVLIETGGKELEIVYEQIASARLAVMF